MFNGRRGAVVWVWSVWVCIDAYLWQTSSSTANISAKITELGSVPVDDIMPGYPEPGRTYRWNATILITLTTGGPLPTDLGKSVAAIEMAIRKARETIVPEVFLHYHILSRPGMTECPDEENHATYLITKYAYSVSGDLGIPPVGLLLGPACTVATQHAGRVAADMRLPLINSQATSDYFDDQSVFKTLTRLAYTMITLDAFSLQVLDALNYTNIPLIYDEVMPWSQVTGQVFERALYYRSEPNRMVPHQMPYKPVGFTNFRRMLREASKVSRAIIILAPTKVLRTWMLMAFDLGMCNGEYVFITYEWFRSPFFGEYTWKHDDSRDEDARLAYRTLFKITSAEHLTSPTFQKWSNEVKELSRSRFGYVYGNDETVAPTVTGLHDGVILYAMALNETLAAGEDPFDGISVTRRMWGRSIPSPEGVLKVKQNDVKDQSYLLQQMDSANGTWVTVMEYDGISGAFRSDVRSIEWIAGNPLPADVPACGFQHEKLICLFQSHSSPTVAAVIVGIVVALSITGVIGFIVNRKRKFEESLQDNWWRVGSDDFKRRHKYDLSLKSLSLKSMPSMKPDVDSNPDTEHDLRDGSVGRYQRKLVFIRNIPFRILVTRELRLWLNQLRAVRHDNLNRLVGVCVDTGFEAIFTDYCDKHSLTDLIHNDRINLDLAFKLSLMTDLVNGMEYLHNSFMQSHGCLHSSNCVIDGRFVLKVTDFHFPQFRPKPSALTKLTSQEINKQLLWTAPEHLRTAMSINGTQKGDVFSAAVVFQEITMRSDPYCDHTEQDSMISYPDIVNLVKEGEVPPYRPRLPLENPKELTAIITACWQEDPAERPTFNALKVKLKHSKLTKEGTITDNLLKRMERYAQDLETLVAERTGAFFEEKKKAEELLYQVMPRAIADVLKVGGYVPAEAFDCVTVYFSDIVGFITLSAESTPFEIVELLNDVYTIFDGIIENFDAYKVETISDTYMVASGLPIRNGTHHAFEIARMALRFLQTVGSFRVRHRPVMRLQLRIGINSGPCAAGIVGLKMPRYCLFGDTINTASRMESTGAALKIHISDKTKVILDTFHCFRTELRGEIEVKGKGKHTTYWLLGTTADGPPIEN